MRKAIFIFLGLLLALSMFSFPADTISAQTVSAPQISPSPPAAVAPADEETIIADIFNELAEARRQTKDKDIQGQLDAIKNGMKDLQDARKKGEEEKALEIKYAIAKRLEWLINQIPTVTPGTTTAVAATASTNPLYDELVRIRAKIDKLIEMEEREIPTITVRPYEPPEIQRPPEMERLIVYSAKFLCGPALGGEGVQPGSYSTAINVHNPNNDTVYLFKKAVIAQREDEPRGRISAFRKVALRPDEAIEIDCIDIVRFFGVQQETRVTAPSQQTQTALQTVTVRSLDASVSFIKGFVVIYATAPLDIVGVYTASTAVGFSLDIEQIPRSTLGVPVFIPEEPEEEVQCPTGCVCLYEKEAYERYGGNAVRCQDAPCDYDDQQNPLYCWRPGEEAQCPTGCACMYEQDAYKRYGKNAALCQDAPCDYDDQQNPLHCWRPGEEAQCPQGCVCATEAEANEYGYNYCQSQKIVCGKDSTTGAERYCFQRSVEQACPQGCYCLTQDEANAKLGKNAALCQDQPCGYATSATTGATTAAQIPKYCWKPAEQVQCPQGCVCTTLDEARQYGYNYCQNQQIQCGTDRYCFQRTVTEVKPTPGRILIDPTQARNPVGSQHTITVVVYDTNGKPMANVRVRISHTGANSFNPIELTTDGNGKCSYSYTGKNTGTDTIVATVDNLSAKATKEWYTAIQPTIKTLPPLK